MYEVSTRRCARLTREVHWIGTIVINLPTFDGLYPLEAFLSNFETSVLIQKILLAMDEALKATPSRWWGTDKSNIIYWTHCQTLMTTWFSTQEVSCEVRYTDKIFPKDHM
jgi:hypothetical protein